LILDLHNSTFLSPIHRLGQVLAGPVRVPAALGSGKPTLTIHPTTQEHGPVLIVGEVGEPVQAEPVRPVLHLVVLVDEPQVVLEDLEAPLLLSQGIVGLAMVDQPGLVQRPHVGVGPLAVFQIVVDDGHVRGRCKSNGEDQTRNHSQNERLCHAFFVFGRENKRWVRERCFVYIYICVR
jgi:hypothetical protein